MNPEAILSPLGPISLHEWSAFAKVAAIELIISLRDKDYHGLFPNQIIDINSHITVRKNIIFTMKLSSKYRGQRQKKHRRLAVTRTEWNQKKITFDKIFQKFNKKQNDSIAVIKP